MTHSSAVARTTELAPVTTGTGDVTARHLSLFHGDCLTWMDSLPPASVDLVVADLPFGITSCEWDTPLPLERLWAAYRRLLTWAGVVVMFGVQPYTSDLVLSNRTWYWHHWIWEKTKATDPLHAKWRPLRAHEDIIAFSARRESYYPQMRTGFAPVQQFNGNGSRIGPIYGVKSGGSAPRSVHMANPDGTRYPTSVLRFPHDRHAWHPVQKPLALLRYLIRTYTKSGDTVLDNVMGSGSTGVAAVMERRAFIGIERDAEYFRWAADRIATQAAWSSEEWTWAITR